MNKMKWTRVGAGLLALLLVVVLGATDAFAASSPTAEAAVNEANAKLAKEAVQGVLIDDGSSNTIFATVDAVSGSDYAEAEKSAKVAGNDKIVAMADIKPSSALSAGKSYKVKISVPGITAADKDKYYVRHRKKVGATYVWETLPILDVANGTITVSMDSFSQVVVVAKASASDSTTNNGSTNTNTNTPGTTGTTVANANNAVIGASISDGSTPVQFAIKSNISDQDYAVAYQVGNARLDATDDVIAMADIAKPATVNQNAGSYTVTLSVPGITTAYKDRIYVRHRGKVGAAYFWETLPIVSVGNGTVTVRMTNFSPVYILLKNAIPANATVTPSTSTTPTTPSTPTNATNSGNTTGDTQSNNNNQSNTQTQNNPVTVNQNVNVNYPDAKKKDKKPAKVTNKVVYLKGAGAKKAAVVAGDAAPKTGQSRSALPVVAVIAAAGMVVCGKKAKKEN